MKRALITIAAIIASNVSAWILLASTSPILRYIHEPAGTNITDALFLLHLMTYLGVAYISFIFLPLSLFMMLIGFVLGRRSLKDCVVGGVLAGLGFYAVFLSIFGPEDAFIFISGAPIGAVSGLIYWRIAIRRTPEAGHAIAEP